MLTRPPPEKHQLAMHEEGECWEVLEWEGGGSVAHPEETAFFSG